MNEKPSMAYKVIALADAFAKGAEFTGQILHNRFKRLAKDNLISGYCSLSKNMIIDIDDQTDSSLLHSFGYHSDDFFRGISSYIIDTDQRNRFLETFLTKPLREACLRGEVQHKMCCLVKLPNETRSRLVYITVKLMPLPQYREVIGFMNIKDIPIKACNCQSCSCQRRKECSLRAV